MLRNLLAQWMRPLVAQRRLRRLVALWTRGSAEYLDQLKGKIQKQVQQ